MTEVPTLRETSARIIGIEVHLTIAMLPRPLQI